MKTLAIDIETYSDVPISLGVYKYVDSPAFRVLLFGYSIDGEPAQVVDLDHGEEIPAEVLEAYFSPEVLKTAFNAAFERVCLQAHFGRPTDNWECTMIRAWELGLSGGLQSVASSLGLEGKIPAGKRLIQKFCVPQGKAQRSLHDEEDWELFKQYCAQDVEVEQSVREYLSPYPLHPLEKALYALDQAINDRGIMVDKEMAEAALFLDTAYREDITSKCREVTGLVNPNSIQELKTFIRHETGMTPSSITKGNMGELLHTYKDYPNVCHALQTRAALGKTSTAKYGVMLDVAGEDDRARGNIQFYGAQRTGRWAGRLIQVHNLPRNHIEELDLARECIKNRDLWSLELYFGEGCVLDILSQCIRTALVPAEGHIFAVADFSAIEARVIAWLAREDWVLEVFQSHGKIYEAAASRMFHVPVESIDKGSDLRQKGKVATLALGYQGGPGALQAMGALQMGLRSDELQDIVDRWRLANGNIVRLWSTLEKAVREAIKEKTTIKLQRGVEAIYRGDFLFLRLPSGRTLGYPKPRCENWDITYKERAANGSSWITKDTYGGKLTENVVQAIARDCLAVAMLRLEDAGYKIVMHVHDEVIIELPEKGAEAELEKICEIMGRTMPWAEDLPLRADGYLCTYYKKD